MGIRFQADHLMCPAYGAALTPLNRPEDGHGQVTSILTETFPVWDPTYIAGDECVNRDFGTTTQTGLIDRIVSRFKSHEDTHIASIPHHRDHLICTKSPGWRPLRTRASWPLLFAPPLFTFPNFSSRLLCGRP